MPGYGRDRSRRVRIAHAHTPVYGAQCAPCNDCLDVEDAGGRTGASAGRRRRRLQQGGDGRYEVADRPALGDECGRAGGSRRLAVDLRIVARMHHHLGIR